MFTVEKSAPKLQHTLQSFNEKYYKILWPRDVCRFHIILLRHCWHTPNKYAVGVELLAPLKHHINCKNFYVHNTSPQNFATILILMLSFPFLRLYEDFEIAKFVY